MAQNNMRKMFTEQQIIDLVKKDVNPLHIYELIGTLSTSGETYTISAYVLSNSTKLYLQGGSLMEPDGATMLYLEINLVSSDNFNYCCLNPMEFFYNDVLRIISMDDGTPSTESVEDLTYTQINLLI